MSAPRHRFVLLDGFRGLAALLVVLFHAERDGSPFYRLDPLFLMVDFFFVLSGFVLLPSLPRSLRSFHRSAAGFVLKRVVRLWPMVLASVALSAALYAASIWWVHRSGAGFDYDVNRTSLRYTQASLLLQIWASKSIFIVVPLWSLSAEWFANLAFAPLAAVRRGIGITVGIAAGVVMYRYGLSRDQEWISWIGPIRGWEAFGRAMAGFGMGLLARRAYEDFDRTGRVVLWAGVGAGSVYWVMASIAHWVYVHTPNQVDRSAVIGVAVLGGTAAAVVAVARPAWGGSRSASMLVLAAALVSAYALLDEYRNFGYGVVYAAPAVFAVLVLAASRVAVDGSGLPGRALLTMGAWSFGVYAFHRTVMDAFNRVTAEPLHWYSAPTYMAPDAVWLHYVVLKTVIVTVVCVALTVVTARAIERPVRAAVAAIAR